MLNKEATFEGKFQHPKLPACESTVRAFLYLLVREKGSDELLSSRYDRITDFYEY